MSRITIWLAGCAVVGASLSSAGIGGSMIPMFLLLGAPLLVHWLFEKNS